MAEFNPKRIERLRRLTWWALVPMPALYTAVIAAYIVRAWMDNPFPIPQVFALVLVTLIITVQSTRFSLDMMHGLGRSKHRLAEQVATFVLALGTVGYVGLVDVSLVLPFTLLPAALAGAIVAATSKEYRWRVSFVTIAATSMATAGGMLAFGQPGQLGFSLIFNACMTGFTIFAYMAQAGTWGIVLDLDRAREMSAELAVAKERLRFASDLHDIQGHHLQVIALKAEIVERLTGVDDDTASTHAAEIAELARTALTDTREVAHGYRRSNLRTELINAREILEAAGIDTTVEGDVSAVAPPLQTLFGSLVREGTTNILRHSTASQCTLEFSSKENSSTVFLRNDGAPVMQAESGSGIDGLRQRFGTVGGRIDIEYRDGWFELAGFASVPGGDQP